MDVSHHRWINYRILLALLFWLIKKNLYSSMYHVRQIKQCRLFLSPSHFLSLSIRHYFLSIRSINNEFQWHFTCYVRHMVLFRINVLLIWKYWHRKSFPINFYPILLSQILDRYIGMRLQILIKLWPLNYLKKSINQVYGFDIVHMSVRSVATRTNEYGGALSIKEDINSIYDSFSVVPQGIQWRHRSRIIQLSDYKSFIIL